MKKNKEIQEELEGLNSILSKKELKDNFEIPADYFENFQKEVFNKLDINEELQSPKIGNAKTRRINFRYTLPIAASLALLLGLFFFTQKNIPEGTIAMDQLSSEDIESYINENIDDFDVELLSMLDSDQQNLLIPNDVQIEDYLDENLDDLDQSLIDELF